MYVNVRCLLLFFCNQNLAYSNICLTIETSFTQLGIKWEVFRNKGTLPVTLKLPDPILSFITRSLILLLP